MHEAEVYKFGSFVSETMCQRFSAALLPDLAVTPVAEPARMMFRELRVPVEGSAKMDLIVSKQRRLRNLGQGHSLDLNARQKQNAITSCPL